MSGEKSAEKGGDKGSERGSDRHADSVPSGLVQGFGLGVRQLREAQGWSQERLAEHSNLNRSYIGEIERGCVIASLLTVEKLAAALKLTPSALLTRGESISQLHGEHNA